LGTISFYHDVFLDVVAIPEPSSIAFLGLAGLAACFLRRRRSVRRPANGCRNYECVAGIDL
jgi:hypothetical protein